MGIEQLSVKKLFSCILLFFSVSVLSAILSFIVLWGMAINAYYWFFLTAFWLITVVYFRIDRYYSYIIGLLLLLGVPLLVYFRQDGWADNLSGAAFLLFIIAAIQQLWEIRYTESARRGRKRDI